MLSPHLTTSIMSDRYTQDRPAYRELLPNGYAYATHLLEPFDGDSDTYATWRDEIIPILEYYDVWDLVSGAEEMGQGREYSFREATARRILMSSLSSGLKSYVAQKPTRAGLKRPQKLWEKLEEWYGAF
jgi:hypothetical protein